MYGKYFSSRHDSVVTVTVSIINNPDGDVNAIYTTCSIACMSLSAWNPLRRHFCINGRGLFPRHIAWEHCNKHYESFNTFKY